MSLRTKVLYEDLDKIEKILEKCDCCFVGMVDQDQAPYVVPFNFGYRNGEIYLHSAQTGRKMDILRKNPTVCISFSTDHQMAWQNKEVACSYLMRYRSVQLFGHIEFIDTLEGKEVALNIIMQKYTGRNFPYGAPSLHEVCCYKVIIEKAFGKEFGY